MSKWLYFADNQEEKTRTMLVDVIRSLYQYNPWANHRILEATSKLTAEQLLGPEGAIYASVRDTLVHIMSAEWIWLSRWKGTSPNAMFDPAEFPDLRSIRARWDGIEKEMAQFVGQLNSQMLSENIAYQNTRGERWVYPLWQQVVHQVNHATQHRSEVAVILTHFGCSPGNLDYLVFQDEIASRA